MKSLVEKSKTAIAIALALTASTAWGDDALYDEAAPADAVFVRVLSEHSDTEKPVSFAGFELPATADRRDTYFAISAANLNGLDAGAYYSVAAGETGAVTIEEPNRETAAKVHLIMLNTGTEAVRLIVPGKDMEVLAALKPGQASSRAVNPIAVNLAVERISDGTILGEFDVRLARGRNLTFVAGSSSARMIENTFGPVLKLK